MKHSIQISTIGLLATFAFASIGCGQGFKSSAYGDQAASASTTSPVSAVESAQQAVTSAQGSMDEAVAALGELQDSNGNLKLDLFSLQSSLQGKPSPLLSGVMSKIREVFDKVFGKATEVKAQIDKARVQLAEALAKCDPADPKQAALVEELKQHLIALDVLEGRFRDQIQLLVGKVDEAMLAVDKAIASATGSIPGVGVIVGVAIDYFVMNDLRDLVADLKGRLLAL